MDTIAPYLEFFVQLLLHMVSQVSGRKSDPPRIERPLQNPCNAETSPQLTLCQQAVSV